MTDLDYWLRRLAQALELASTSDDSRAEAAHRAMAGEYCRRIERIQRGRRAAA